MTRPGRAGMPIEELHKSVELWTCTWTCLHRFFIFSVVPVVRAMHGLSHERGGGSYSSRTRVAAKLSQKCRNAPCSSSPASSGRGSGPSGSGLPGPVASGGLRRGGVGKSGGGGGLWAAAVGGGDAAGRGRRGDMRWARHRAGERGSELISVGGGGGQRRRRRSRSRGRRGKAGARRRELLRVDRFHSRAR